MKNTGREFIDALEGLAFLEWYRYSKFESDVVAPTSATIVWRFDLDRTDKETVTQIEKAIRVALVDIAKFDWSLKYTGRNWVLTPMRVAQLEETGQFKNDREICSHLAQVDPFFFSRAHDDLLKIAGAIATCDR